MTSKVRGPIKFKPNPLDLPLREMLARRTNTPWRDMVSRPIICTPIYAAYAEISQWVIAVQGTPVRGLILFDVTYHMQGCHLYEAPKCRRVTGKDYRVVVEFMHTFLSGVMRTGVGTVDQPVFDDPAFV